jgi:hypothetical protein
LHRVQMTWSGLVQSLIVSGRREGDRGGEGAPEFLQTLRGRRRRNGKWRDGHDGQNGWEIEPRGVPDAASN